MNWPGLPYTDGYQPWTYGYLHYGRYSYSVPTSSFNSAGTFSFQMKDLGTAAWWYGGYQNVMYNALVACQLSPNTLPHQHPHGGEGVNLLYRDGSVSWFARPAAGWWLNSSGGVAGNITDGQVFWKEVNLKWGRQ